jgi:uncharacterized membrane protein YtjA (UPF0391 family)
MLPRLFRTVGYFLRLRKPRTDCNRKSDSQYLPTRRSKLPQDSEARVMLHYAAVFFVIALVAAFFGFGGIAVGAAGIAKILFIVFLAGAIIAFLMSMGRRV